MKHSSNYLSDTIPLRLMISLLASVSSMVDLFCYLCLNRDHRVCPTIPWTLHLLGHPDEDLCLHLRLRGARHHHHGLLHFDGPAAEERAPAVRLTREGPQPPPDHSTCAGGGRGLRCVLDAHPHLHLGQGTFRQRARDHPRHGRLLLMRGAGLHQQQPQPYPLRLPGRELQEVLQGLLLPRGSRTWRLTRGKPGEEHPTGPLVSRRRPGRREASQERMTSHGHVLYAVSGLGGLQWPGTDSNHHCHLRKGKVIYI